MLGLKWAAITLVVSLSACKRFFACGPWGAGGMGDAVTAMQSQQN